MKKIEVILISVFLFLSFCACTEKNDFSEEAFYCFCLENDAPFDQPHGALTAEISDKVSKNSKPEQVLAVLRQYPFEDEHVSPFPENADFEVIKEQNGVLYIQLNEAFSQISGVKKTFATACLTLTLCQLDGVDAVELSVTGDSISFSESERLSVSDFLTLDPFFQNE